MKGNICVLVVDDEVYAVEGILQGVPWEEIGVSEVRSAYSMQQAIGIMEQSPVDILLCDIEMPRGSGLELSQWAVANNSGIVCLFLTSHANFSYAKMALQIGSVDYLLKPIPYDQLAESLQKAAAEVELRRKRAEAAEQAAYWNVGKGRLIEQLVVDITQGSLPASRNRILQEIHSRHLPERCLSARFTPALLELLGPPEDQRWDAVLMEYGLRNIIRELTDSDGSAVMVCRLEKDIYLLLFPYTEPKNWYGSTCLEILETCRPILERDINCYLGRPVPVEQLRRETERLGHARLNNLSRNTLVEPPVRELAYQEQHCAAQFRQWELYYELGQFHKAKESIQSTLEQLAGKKSVDRALLRQVIQLIERSILHTMENKGVDPRLLFGKDRYAQMADIATQSVQGMNAWVAYITDVLEDTLGVRSPHLEAVQQAQCYIREHLGEALTRSEISASVYLSPDYLSHLFKEETGSTISEYIMRQRMQRAEELLRGTDLPIFSIALTVGYTNLPYFSKLFRRHTGITPTQYRQSAAFTPGELQ